jgi:hypothetical protein
MDEHEWLVERFEDNRSHLRVVAYRYQSNSKNSVNKPKHTPQTYQRLENELPSHLSQ